MSATRGRARQPQWVAGVDLGGTWVRVLALDSRGRRRRLTRRAPKLSALAPVLRRAWKQWRLDPRDVRGLVVASRGIWTPGERIAEARRLRALARRVRVIPDVEAAYRGALDQQPGVLVLAGTGSIALGHSPDGRWARAGGFGPLLGDEGSAFWIGREWLRATTLGEDFQPVRRIVTASDPVARIAALAPGVLRSARSGHLGGRRIVAGAQAALADLIMKTVRGIHLKQPVSVSWAGSLLDDGRFRNGVWRMVRRRGLRVSPVPPNLSAVEAAMRLAQRLR